MITIPDDELEALATDLESDRVERKERLAGDAPDKLRQAICTFGPRRAIADRQEERVLNERRRFRDLPFDLQPVRSAKLVDLNRRMFEEEYLPSAVAPDVLAANERSYEERLAATRMTFGVTDPTPTLIGILVLAIRPQDFVPGAYVQFLRIDGAELGDPIVDEEAVDGPLAQLLRRLDDKLRTHVRAAVDLTSASTEVKTRDYPIEAPRPAGP